MKVALLHVFPQEGWVSIDVYSRRVTEHLARLAPEVEFIQVRPNAWRFPDVKAMMPYGRYASLRTLGLYLSRWIKYPLIIQSIKADVYHILDNSYGHLTHFLNQRQTIVTYHGASDIRRWSKRGPADFIYSLAFRGMLHANTIITVSECTKNEISSKTSFPVNRIIPVYHGIDEDYYVRPKIMRTKIRERFLDSTHNIFLLHVGHTGPRKNTELLYHIVARLKKNGIMPRLIRIGRAPTTDQWELIDKLHVRENFINLGVLPNLELPNYYSAADFLIMPSHYEGFGLPLIEGMACGSTILCSNIDVFHEICGPAAIYCDPNDPISFADAIAHLVEHPELVENLRQAALERARLFDWAENARKLLEIYYTVASSSGRAVPLLRRL